MLQLQLHRNEVIALVNLLNRLSESVKFVHEKGPSIERIMKDRPLDPSVQELGLCQRLWESVVLQYVKLLFALSNPSNFTNFGNCSISFADTKPSVSMVLFQVEEAEITASVDFLFNF